MRNIGVFGEKCQHYRIVSEASMEKSTLVVALVSVGTILTFTTKRYIPSNQSKIEIILMKIEDVAKLLLEQGFFHTVISTEDWYISDREFLLTMPKNNESIFVCQLLLHSDVTKNFKKIF